jgi:type I restriction enzyme S subunit
MSYLPLSEICTTFKSDILINKIEKESGNYPVFGAKGIVANIDSFQREKEYISVIKWGAGVGRAELRPGYSSIVATMLGIVPNKDINIDWLCYLLQSMHLIKIIFDLFYIRFYNFFLLNNISLGILVNLL